MKRQTISTFMTQSPHSIDAGQTLVTAHELMRKHRIRHLPVVRGDKLVGLLSQRDLHLIEALSDVDPAQVRIEEAMSQVPFAVAPDAPLERVVEEMAEKKFGSVVVVDHDRIVGVFTTTDALRVLAAVLKKRQRDGRG